MYIISSDIGICLTFSTIPVAYMSIICKLTVNEVGEAANTIHKMVRDRYAHFGDDVRLLTLLLN